MMRDTIYREDAIKALEELSACEDYGVEIGTDEETYIGKYEAITEISDLPSARPKEGKWIEVEWYPIAVPSKWCENDEKPIYASKLQCSKCGFTRNFLDGHTAQYNFCPQCGADMRGERSGTDKDKFEQ